MKYVMFEGELRPWPEVAAIRAFRTGRSSLPCPSIISDHLDGVKNPVDGKTYDSKSEYYRAVKLAGCEIVGNDSAAMAGASTARSNVPKEDVGEALRKVKQGYKPELPMDAAREYVSLCEQQAAIMDKGAVSTNAKES